MLRHAGADGSALITDTVSLLSIAKPTAQAKALTITTAANNTLTVTAHARVPDPGGGNRSNSSYTYVLAHTGNATGGDGERWRFPRGHQPGSTVNGTAHAAPAGRFSLAKAMTVMNIQSKFMNIYEVCEYRKIRAYRNYGAFITC